MAWSSTPSPPGTSYAIYTTDALTVAAGAHTITFQALDSAGGDNPAFIDDVEMTQVTAAGLSDAGFESPSPLGTWSGYSRYGPSGTAWTYSSSAGGACGNGSVFISGQSRRPRGPRSASSRQADRSARSSPGWPPAPTS